MGARRDKVAMHLCNVILRMVATKWYREQIDSAIRYGLAMRAFGDRFPVVAQQTETTHLGLDLHTANCDNRRDSE